MDQLSDIRRRKIDGRKGSDASPASGEIDTAPLREAFERSGISLSELARRLKWMRPDQPRAARTLGYHRYHARSGEYLAQEQVTYETALRICRALDADPVDVGL